MKRILIIEDNQAILENIQELLELENYTVMTAIDGLDGFEKIKSSIPDLILCDIKMPRMDGFQLLTCLRKKRSFLSTPFIFFTASSEATEIKKGLEMGASGYIIKPFTAEELMQTIKKQLPVNK